MACRVGNRSRSRRGRRDIVQRPSELGIALIVGLRQLKAEWGSGRGRQRQGLYFISWKLLLIDLQFGNNNPIVFVIRIVVPIGRGWCQTAGCA
jgi:hypothetical protein